MDLIPDALSMSLQMLDDHRRKRALDEAREREWPSVVLEDLLDADEIKERTTYPVNSILGLTNII